MTISSERIPLHRRKWFLPVVAAVALGAGLLLGGAGREKPPAGVTHGAEEKAVEFWTCSMHPQIRQPEPGLCPICGMDLIPVYADAGANEGGPRTLSLSETARKLADIRVVEVKRQPVDVELRLAGMVKVDETRLGSITARMPGRIDRLWVDYTGAAVQEGDPMVDLYSPELLSAQQELLQAAAAEQAGSGSAGMLRAVRDKLRLWGVTGDQIEEILKRGEPAEHLTLRSPMTGVVLDRHASVGMYVDTGMRIYTIADLSHVWVVLDAYESDVPWIREGQDVQFDVEAYPVSAFRGKVAFIDPVLDPRTRTVKVRVDVENRDGSLKPEMFVRAIVRAPVPRDSGRFPLVIPATAPLITGTRAVVYVEVPGEDGQYEGREVVLGMRAGEFYVVREGLAEGERVVVNGAFKIDSAIQILAGPSMMDPEGGVSMTGHQHGVLPSTRQEAGGSETAESPDSPHAGHSHD